MWRAGTPATIDFDATLRVTPQQAPTIAKSPMVTPGIIRAPETLRQESQSGQVSVAHLSSLWV